MPLSSLIRCLFCALYLLSQSTIFAQDSLPTKKTPLLQRIDAQIESLHSFIQNNVTPINILGLNVGVNNPSKRFRLGLGLYYSAITGGQIKMINWNPIIQQNAPNATILTYQNKKVYLASDNILLLYMMPNVQYQFFASKWLEFALNCAIGVGYSSKKRYDAFTSDELQIFVKNKKINTENTLFPSSFGGVVNFNLSHNAKIAGLAGYRLVLNENATSEDLDGWYYQIALKINPFLLAREIHKDIKKFYHNKRMGAL